MMRSDWGSRYGGLQPFALMNLRAARYVTNFWPAKIEMRAAKAKRKRLCSIFAYGIVTVARKGIREARSLIIKASR